MTSFQRTIGFLLWANIAVGVSQAEWMTGVLYGENGGNAVRGIELAAGNQIYRLEYTKEIHLRSLACWDVGAIWRVNVARVNGNIGSLVDAICSGQFDERARRPVVLVWKYLNDLAVGHGTSLTDISSSRWKSSAEFEQYQTQAKDLVLDFNRMALQDVSISSKLCGPTELKFRVSNGFLLHKRLVNVTFGVVQNVVNKRWEIDEIRIE